MRRAKWGRLGIACSLGLAWGCASAPRDAGVGEVSRIVEERTGQRLEWQPGQPIEPPTDDDLQAQLAGGLTADEAVAVAFRRNRDLLAALEGLGIARADLMAARTIRNPILDAEVHFPGEDLAPYELTLTQTLIDLLHLRRNRAIGAAEFEAARLRVTAAVVGFAGQVKARYYTLQAAQAALAQQRTMAVAAEAAAELAQRQHDAGNITDLDLETEQALYEEAKLGLARAQLDEVAARERLLADLGALGQLPLQLPAMSPPPPGEEPTAEELETVLAERLDLAIAEAELAKVRQSLRGARGAAVWDELAVGVHRDREASGERADGLSAEVPIPIFDSGLSARTRADALLRQAELRIQALTSSARSEVREARERLLEARARATYIASVVIPRRERILYLTQLEYNAMLRGVYDLIRARQGLAAAHREGVFALLDYWLARTELDVAMSGVTGFGVTAQREGLPRLEGFLPPGGQEPAEREGH
jgi:cobalt-zinc-cadmium efflux system outer membrane protein